MTESKFPVITDLGEIPEFIPQETILGSLKKALSIAEEVRNRLSIGKTWVAKCPSGETLIKVALIYEGSIVSTLEFSPLDGSVLPRGYHPRISSVEVSLRKVIRRAREVLRDLKVLKAAEYREPELCWVVPLAYEGKIVSHIKIYYDASGVLLDFPATQESMAYTFGKVARLIVHEWLFALSLVGLIISSLWLRRLPTYSFSEIKVTYVLFVFLVIINGLQNSGFFSLTASKFQKGKWVSLKLILLTGFLSMFVTNDIAILTMVPLTLLMRGGDVSKLVILETITANAVSAVSPFGNPQNIFIYFRYDLSPVEFIKTIAPLSIILLALILLLAPKMASSSDGASSIKLSEKAYIYLALFVTFILAVLKLLPLELSVIALAYAILFDKRSLKVDYFLLGTFLVFFGFTDNLLKMVNFSLDSPAKIFLYSAFGSQIISNVPSALLFADLTSCWKPLLWGVSVGGFGNIIGSLASFISYRLYKDTFPGSRGYLLRFHLYNYLMFGVGVALFFLLTP